MINTGFRFGGECNSADSLKLCWLLLLRILQTFGGWRVVAGEFLIGVKPYQPFSVRGSLVHDEVDERCCCATFCSTHGRYFRKWIVHEGIHGEFER